MDDVTLGIAVLLAAGLLTAKILQLFRLPSVTGFILAGLALGPSWLGLITMESVGQQLEHFTQIALMLIAFGIGEHIELRRLGGIARDVGYISIIQALVTMLFVAGGTYLAAWLLAGPTSPLYNLILALLLGAVAIATAPAALLHVVRETGAKGRFTSTLMAVVAVDNGVAIMVFGLTMSLAHQLIGPETASAAEAIGGSLAEIVFSLLLGITTGLLIDFTLNRLHNRGEMLTGGLALLLLCGEITRLLHFSPLLAGMAAGFTIINRAERDVRLFRAINAFEPPIYVLFFTLAGVHLDLGSLQLAGWIGIVCFISRLLGKYFGTWLGGIMSGASGMVRNYLGLAMFPQAGVAIGLVVLIGSDPSLSDWSVVITPVILAGVVFSELIGPLMTRYTLVKAGEGMSESEKPAECGQRGALACKLWLRSPDGINLVPWEGGELRPASNPSGVVVFGAHHFATVRGLARISTILAHHYHAFPMAVRIFNASEKQRIRSSDRAALFLAENDEVASLGYPLEKEIIFDNPASGLVAAAEYNNAHAVVLGYPAGSSPRNFHGLLDTVAANISCPLIAVRFVGTFKTGRILVPFIYQRELTELLPVLEAMAMTTMPEMTFLHLLHFDSSREEIKAADLKLQEWLADNFFDIQTRHKIELAESRLEYILQEVNHHDLIIMSASRRQGLEKIFFGSLANSVVQNTHCPVIAVYAPGAGKDRDRDEQ